MVPPSWVAAFPVVQAEPLFLALGPLLAFLSFTLEFYLIADICLDENSRTWETSLTSSKDPGKHAMVGPWLRT